MCESEIVLPVSQPDMTLSDQELFGDDHPHDHCGVFGVWAPGEDVSRLTYFSLYALQHRGQQSAGIATSNGKQILVYKDQGLVSQVFSEQSLQGLRGHIALGHVRYATTGADVWRNAQPTLGPTPTGTLALAHNGNLTNTVELRELASEIADDGEDFERGASTDTSLVTALLGMADRIPGPTPFIASPSVTPSETDGDEVAPASSVTDDLEPAPLVGAALKVLPRIKGAFSLVFMDENTLYAARDPHGYRPLVLGRLASGWVVASETAALDIVGGTFVREVEPGEMIRIDESGLHSTRFAPARPKGCLFEYVYVARPDTVISGRRIHNVRVKVGKILAEESPADADLVIPVPESGIPGAIGFAAASGIPFGNGLVKNSYVGRTFIQPTQSLRNMGIRLKLNPLRDVIEGRRLVVVDDSIVRGNTQRQLVRMLREAGAAQVHVRISSPPLEWPCFYGLDFATRAQLIAPGLSVDEIRRSIGADSLGYISLEGLIRATHVPKENLCRACFDGEYPIPVPHGAAVEMGLHAEEAPAACAGHGDAEFDREEDES